MKMIVFDGLTTNLIPSFWQMVLMELITIFVEMGIVAVYWDLKEGKLRWYEIAILITVANLLTMGFGIYWYLSHGGWYY